MESVEVNGRAYPVSRVFTKNRTAMARLKGESIVISIPSRWSAKEKEKTGKSLLDRVVKALECGKWHPDENRKSEFSDGQRIDALGREFTVSFIPSDGFRSRVVGDRIEVRVDGSHPQMRRKASDMVRRRVTETLLPMVKERVRYFNELHFKADIKRVTIRDNTSRWGSCSPDFSISLNFRLLLMPRDILDYVIVHELAHTRYRSHGKRFWALVEKVIPDHLERRRYLRDNKWLRPAKRRIGQAMISDFF